NGENQLATKIAKDLFKNAHKGAEVQYRIGALKLLTDIGGKSFTKNLVKAANDKNAEYRAAALAFASPYLDSENVREWVKGLRKSGINAKAGIIHFLGTSNNKAIVPALKRSLESKFKSERAAAIAALSKLSGDESVPVLLSLLTKNDDADSAAIKEAFLTMEGNNLPLLLVKALPDVTSA